MALMETTSVTPEQLAAQLQPAISKTLGQWASERNENRLSIDLNFGPVRLDAARYVARSIAGSAAPAPARPTLTVVR
jgi:hypothetical protein